MELPQNFFAYAKIFCIAMFKKVFTQRFFATLQLHVIRSLGKTKKAPLKRGTFFNLTYFIAVAMEASGDVTLS